MTTVQRISQDLSFPRSEISWEKFEEWRLFSPSKFDPATGVSCVHFTRLLVSLRHYLKKFLIIRILRRFRRMERLFIEQIWSCDRRYACKHVLRCFKVDRRVSKIWNEASGLPCKPMFTPEFSAFTISLVPPVLPGKLDNFHDRHSLLQDEVQPNKLMPRSCPVQCLNQILTMLGPLGPI